MTDFYRLPAGIDGGKDTTHLCQTEPRLKEFGAILDHEGNSVTLAHPQPAPRGGRIVDPAIEFAKGDSLMAKDEERIIRCLVRGLFQEGAYVQSTEIP
jgi:hypothetical protein